MDPRLAAAKAAHQAQTETPEDYIKELSLSEVNFCFVSGWQSVTGEWTQVDDWHALESQGEPPLIVVANPDTSGRLGRFTISRGVEASPVYGSCGLLTCYSGEDATHEELLEAAVAIGCGGCFDPENLGRQVNLWHGGTVPIHPALITLADHAPIRRIGDFGATEKFVERIEKAGSEFAWSPYVGAIMFEWEFLPTD